MLILADHWQIYPLVKSSCGEFYICTIRANTGRSLADFHPGVSTLGEFYIRTIRANTGRSLADFSPGVSTFGEFYIGTIRAYIGRPTGRSILQYSHHVVNFTFVLLELILADQLVNLPPHN